jgi:hypothetical protein
MGGGFTIICREKEEDEEMKEGERRVACQVITKILLATLPIYISDDFISSIIPFVKLHIIFFSFLLFQL